MRRGWCLGPAEFKASLLERMGGSWGNIIAGNYPDAALDRSSAAPGNLEEPQCQVTSLAKDSPNPEGLVQTIV